MNSIKIIQIIHIVIIREFGPTSLVINSIYTQIFNLDKLYVSSIIAFLDRNNESFNVRLQKHFKLACY